MYEIFMTATVDDRDFATACSILGGVCSMEPWQSINRVLYYQGPPKPSGLSNQSSIEKPVRKNTAPLWKELHQSLSRQSFIVQARYDILKDRDMGGSAVPMDINNTSGTLRWTDFPDPPHGKPVLTQRKKVELWDQKNIPSVLTDNQHQFKGETIEEIYRFFRDEVEFSLTKQFFFKPIAEFTPLESRNGQVFAPSPDLPSWDALTPVDMQNRWILQARIHVLQDNKPDELRKAQDQLLAIRNELDGVFKFRDIDRKVHDTRVAQQPQGVQALPQKVRIGKT